MSAYRPVTACRVCGASSFDVFLDLGEMPLANAFVRPERAAEPEPRFPLAAQRCLVCGLVQLTVVVDPAVLFRYYLYASSASAPMVEHFDGYAREVAARYARPGELVVEIGSNDGVLLDAFARRGLRVLGVEPAANLAAVANARGLETWNDFFGAEVARRAAVARGRAAIIAANNVLAHIDDLADVLRGADELLAPDGVLVAEFPYLVDLLDRVEFDTIYHEHLSYFALLPFDRALRAAGLELIDARRIPTHGGSLRIVGARAGRRERSAGLAALLETEASMSLTRGDAYERFSARVLVARSALVGLVGELRGAGRRVAALGASAKGNTLLNFCGLGPDRIDYVADSTPIKQGFLTPGTHVPIRPERALRDDRPDYTLLLAWNYADAIVRRFGDYVASGGRFIHPVPRARVLPA